MCLESKSAHYAELVVSAGPYTGFLEILRSWVPQRTKWEKILNILLFIFIIIKKIFSDKTEMSLHLIYYFLFKLFNVNNK